MSKRTLLFASLLFCLFLFVRFLFHLSIVPAPGSATQPNASLGSLPTKALFTDKKAISQALDRWGIASVAAELKKRQAPGVSCHRAMHLVAHQLYTDHGFAGIARCPIDTCEGGCQHGMIEALAEDKAELSDRELISLACEKRSPDVSMHTCTHGIGHAFFFKYKRNFARAYAACSQISGGYAHSCRGGVAMQYVFDFESDLKKESRSGQMFSLCMRVAAKESGPCYRYMVAFAHEQMHASAAEIGGRCVSLAAGHREQCVAAHVELLYKYDPRTSPLFCDVTYTGTVRGACNRGRALATSTDLAALNQMLTHCSSGIYGDAEDCSIAIEHAHHEQELRPAASMDTPPKPVGARTFFSPRWDVHFEYPATIGSDEVRVQEVADKIYLYRRARDFVSYPTQDMRLGHYLAVFEKDPRDPLDRAITKRILVYPGQADACRISTVQMPRDHITHATIELTKQARASQRPEDLDRQGTCSAYRGDPHTHYFWMDDRFPDRFFFYSLDEEEFKLSVDTGQTKTWRDTLIIAPHVKLTYPPPHYGNLVKIDQYAPAGPVRVGDSVTLSGQHLTPEKNEIYILPRHFVRENWWRTWYCVMRYTDMTYPSSGGTMHVPIPAYTTQGGCTDYRGEDPTHQVPEREFTFFLHNAIGLYTDTKPFTVLTP